jgi:hypothetical protein
MSDKSRLLHLLFLVAVLALTSLGRAAGQGNTNVYVPLIIGDGLGDDEPPGDPTGPNSAWGTVPTPNLGPADNVLTGISALSSDDAWAVGTAGNDLLTLHWDGSSWSNVPAPNLLFDAKLNDVAAIAGDDVWAVGTTGSSAGIDFDTVTMHWDGTEWAIIPSPNPAPDSYNELHAVAAVSANDVWAVGEYLGEFYKHPLILHWDGLSWSIVQQNCAEFNSLIAITVVAPDDIWATGNALTCHYDGNSWTEVASPQPRPAFREIGYSLKSIDAVSPTDIWIVGTRTLDYGQYIAIASLAEHWDGTQWTAYYNHFPILGRGVVALASDNVWAVGSDIAHWNGQNWNVVPSPKPGQGNQLNDIDAVGDYEVWAAGYFLNDGYTEQTLIENAPSQTQGTIKGDTNYSGAVITWIGPVSGSTETNVFGEYGAAGLPAGTYDVIASAAFCTPDVATIMVVAGTTVFQDFELDCS